MKRDKPGKKAFWKKIKYPHPLSYFKKSAVDVMFVNPHNPESFYPWPADRYFGKVRHEAPFRLIDAINENNELVIRIGLNNKREPIIEEFSKVITVAFKEMEKYGKKRSKISEREFDLYLKAYQRKQQGWTFPRIAKEMFPRDFKEAENGGKVRSAIEKARRFCHEAEKLFGGDASN